MVHVGGGATVLNEVTHASNEGLDGDVQVTDDVNGKPIMLHN